MFQRLSYDYLLSYIDQKDYYKKRDRNATGQSRVLQEVQKVVDVSAAFFVRYKILFEM